MKENNARRFEIKDYFTIIFREYDFIFNLTILLSKKGNETVYANRRVLLVVYRTNSIILSYDYDRTISFIVNFCKRQN